MREVKEYALYKGEELLGMGTIRELAERLILKRLHSTTIKHRRT